MKKFIFYIAIILLVIIAIMVVSDALYTYVYENAAPRNKTQYVLKLKDKKINYVFLGSSRVENHIVTKLVEQQTSKTAINLGMQGSKLDDIYLVLKLLLENNVTFDKIFIQIDYTFNNESPSVNVSSESLPYLRTNKVVNAHNKLNNPNYYVNYYIPFFRFASNDYKIGFRDFFSTLVKNKANYDFEDGFDARNGTFDNARYELPAKISNSNKVFDSIKKLCFQRKIDVVFYCSPFCSQVVESNYVEQLKLKIPELKDYSKSILDNKYFINCGHLNEDGANLFTQLIIDDCIKNEK